MKLLIADDHPLVVAGIREVLAKEPLFDIVGSASSGSEVMPLIGRLNPDVVLLDLRMPGVDGLGCLERIHDRYPKIKVVVLSMTTDPEQIQAAFKRGACGFVIKSIDPADLASAIRQAVNGTAFHALGLPALNENAVARAAGLTDRELMIMKAVSRGLSNQAIGKELWVTEQTVKFHLTNLYRKLGVTNRTEAARWAFAKGLVDEDAVTPLSDN
ncbi:MAG TPA: response regulator transcription factor [Gaiellaceae bacterium]|jgi:DNA-binding NarL/FixJ family response regulator|nr:response regulator transcription factor [Gaiellaceae bacterium]